MKLAALLPFLAAFLLTGCATPSPEDSLVDALGALDAAPSIQSKVYPQKIVGRWYGDQPTREGGRKRWSPRYTAGGYLDIEFIITDRSGEATVTRDNCIWAVHGDFLLTTELRPDGPRKWAVRSEPQAWIVYKIIHLDDSEFRYRSLITGVEYVVHRVADNFEIPVE